jgi:hypothetical protein
MPPEQAAAVNPADISKLNRQFHEAKLRLRSLLTGMVDTARSTRLDFNSLT